MNASASAAVLLQDRFRGRSDLYLRVQPGGVEWVREPVTSALFVDHVEGRERIGLAPDPAAAPYLCIDLDGRREGPADALAKARTVVSTYETFLPIGAALLEQSRSGIGFHCWTLFDPGEPPTLDEARRFARGVLRAVGLPDDGAEGKGHPGVFPHPPGKKEAGRAAFLPWAGLAVGATGAVFVDLDGEPLENQEAALLNVRLVTRAELLAAIAKAEDIAPPIVEVRERAASEPRPYLGTMTPYAAKALREESERVRAAVDGNRHHALIAASLALGELVAGGALPESVVWGELLASCEANGMLSEGREAEVRRTIADGIAGGSRFPRAPDPRAGDGKGYVPSDLGNAERFVTEHGGRVLHVHAWRRWYVWTGSHWKPDTTQETVTLARETLRRQTVAALDMPENDAGKRRALRHALDSERAPRVRAMLDLAGADPGIATTPDALDCDPWLLSVENGTLDLRAGELREHRAADRITHCLPFAHDPGAGCPLWEAFLARVLPDADLRSFVQRAAGYTLTGSTQEQCFFLLHGVGANGKTTFLRVLVAMLGTLSRTARFETFLVKQGERISSDVARLAGARLVVSSEPEGERRLAEGTIKDLTGGERVTARFLYSGEFEFVPAFKLWLAANHRPRISGTDLGIWRRVRLVPFEVVIPPEEQDPILAERLLGELPGILAWAVEGCRLWREHGLGTCAAVEDRTSAYRREEDRLAEFLDACVLGPDEECPRCELYRAYTTWAEDNGETPASARAFNRVLRERPGVSEKTVRGNRRWTGIGLRA